MTRDLLLKQLAEALYHAQMLLDRWPGADSESVERASREITDCLALVGRLCDEVEAEPK